MTRRWRLHPPPPPLLLTAARLHSTTSPDPYRWFHHRYPLPPQENYLMISYNARPSLGPQRSSDVCLFVK